MQMTTGIVSHRLDLPIIKTTVDPDLEAMVTTVAMTALGARDFRDLENQLHETKQQMTLRMVEVVEEMLSAGAKTTTTELVEVELDTTLKTTLTGATETQHQVVEIDEVTEMEMVVTLTISVALPLQDVQLAMPTETSQWDEP